jgi:hypothetical protein
VQQSVDNQEGCRRKPVVLLVAEPMKQTTRWDEREGPIVFLRKKEKMATEGQK